MQSRLVFAAEFFLAFCMNAYGVETRTTEETLLHHLQAIGDGDTDAIMSDYAQDAVLFTPDGVLRGRDEVRSFFEGILADILPPGSRFEMLQQVVEGEIAYIVWSAESVGYTIPSGTDTFIIRDGKIVAQTLAVRLLPKAGGEAPPPKPLELAESAEKDVFTRRMQAIMDGDIDAMMSCYAEDAVLFMANRVLHGYDEIGTLFAAGFGSGNYSGLTIDLSQLIVEGEIVYAVWSAKSASFNTPFGTDTFIIRDGKIVAQTSAAQVAEE